MSVEFDTDALKSAFLSANRKVKVEVDAWKDQLLDDKPFDESTSGLVRANVTAGNDNKPAKIGSAGDVEFTLGGEAHLKSYLEIVRPADLATAETAKTFVDSKLLPPTALDAASHYLGFTAIVGGSVNAGAKGKTGILTFGLGAQSSGDCEFTRLVRYPNTSGARTSLLDFFAGLDWPCRYPNADSLKGYHELVSFSHRGNLKLSASLGAGYDFSGTAGFELGDLTPQLVYKVKVGASINYGFSIGGTFRYAVAAGTQDGWIRVQVGRERQVGRTIGLGLEIGADYEIKGLPEKIDELIDGMFGLNIGSAVGYLEAIAGSNDFAGATAALKEKFGKLAESRVSAAIAPALAKAFDSAGYVEFQSVAKQLLTAYKKINDDVQKLVDRIGAKQAELLKFIDEKLLAIRTKEDLAKISDNDTWQALNDLAGDKLVDAFYDNAIVQEIQEKIKKVRDLIDSDEVKKALNFWNELQERAGVAKIAEDLATAANPDALKALLNDKIRGAAESVFDFATAKIDGSAAGQKLYADVKAKAVKLTAWKKKLDAALKKARKGKFNASIAAEFAHTESRQALLDIEFNSADANGEKMFKAALNGDFEGALSAAGSGNVRLIGGKIREVEKSTQSLTVAALGWSASSVETVEQLVETEVTQDSSGLVYLFSMETSYTKSVKKGTPETLEETQTKFLLTASGQGTGSAKNFALKAVKDMAVEYSLTRKDAITTPDELKDYLQFAQDLGLFARQQDFNEYVEQLLQDLGSDIGKVEVTYAIKYAPTAFLEVFYRLSAEDISTKARAAVKRYFGQCASRNIKAKETVQLYLEATKIERDATSMQGQKAGGGGFNKIQASVYRPGQKTIQRPEMPLLSWAKEEEAFVKALLDLDKALSPGGTEEDLKKAHKELCRVPEGKPIFGTRFWDENVFFLAVDELIRTIPAGGRNAVVTLEATSPTGDKHFRILPIGTR